MRGFIFLLTFGLFLSCGTETYLRKIDSSTVIEDPITKAPEVKPGEVLETFSYKENNKLDLVFAFDNSVSMGPEIASVRANIEEMIREIMPYEIDIQVIFFGVVIEADYYLEIPSLSYTLTTELYKKDPQKFFDNITEIHQNFEDTLEGGTEIPFQATLDVIEKQKSGQLAQSIFRPEANIFLNIVQDDDEQSFSLSVSDFIQELNSFYDNPDSSLQVNSIYNRAADDGNRFERVAELTKGISVDVDDPNFSEKFKNLGKDIATKLQALKLSKKADSNTIKILINDRPYLGKWSYDSTANTISFEDSVPRGTEIKVIYKVL